MSEEEIMASIRGFCDALMRRDVEKALSLCTEDAALLWGPFVFEGRREIKRWMTGLGELFPKLKLRDKSLRRPLRVKGNRATHDLVIEIILPDSQMARMPGFAVYEFRHRKIRRVKFTLSYGYVTVKLESTKRSAL